MMLVVIPLRGLMPKMKGLDLPVSGAHSVPRCSFDVVDEAEMMIVLLWIIPLALELTRLVPQDDMLSNVRTCHSSLEVLRCRWSHSRALPSVQVVAAW